MVSISYDLPLSFRARRHFQTGAKRQASLLSPCSFAIFHFFLLSMLPEVNTVPSGLNATQRTLLCFPFIWVYYASDVEQGKTQIVPGALQILEWNARRLPNQAGYIGHLILDTSGFR
jgi:hypothetical protein